MTSKIVDSGLKESNSFYPALLCLSVSGMYDYLNCLSKNRIKSNLLLIVMTGLEISTRRSVQLLKLFQTKSYERFPFLKFHVIKQHMKMEEV